MQHTVFTDIFSNISSFFDGFGRNNQQQPNQNNEENNQNFWDNFTPLFNWFQPGQSEVSEQLRRMSQSNAELKEKLKPKEILGTRKITSSEYVEEMECVICMERFEFNIDYTTLPCGHLFHKECLMPWLTQHHSCPICRTEFKPVPESSSSQNRRTPPNHNHRPQPNFNYQRSPRTNPQNAQRPPTTNPPPGRQNQRNKAYNRNNRPQPQSNRNRRTNDNPGPIFVFDSRPLTAAEFIEHKKCCFCKERLEFGDDYVHTCLQCGHMLHQRCLSSILRTKFCPECQYRIT